MSLKSFTFFTQICYHVVNSESGPRLTKRAVCIEISCFIQFKRPQVIAMDFLCKNMKYMTIWEVLEIQCLY